MRVITGLARGRNLQSLKGLDVRPTTDKVKEAVFSSIQFEVEGARVLDLFCGSGQMGIEALSRGAQHCVFADNSRAALEVTGENLRHTALFHQSKTVCMDYKAYLLSCGETFDLAFLDPPYNRDYLSEALPLLEPRMSKGGVILAEHEYGYASPEKISAYVRAKQYRYGKIAFSAYRHIENV